MYTFIKECICRIENIDKHFKYNTRAGKQVGCTSSKYQHIGYTTHKSFISKAKVFNSIRTNPEPDVFLQGKNRPSEIR